MEQIQSDLIVGATGSISSLAVEQTVKQRLAPISIDETYF